MKREKIILLTAAVLLTFALGLTLSPFIRAADTVSGRLYSRAAVVKTLSSRFITAGKTPSATPASGNTGVSDSTPEGAEPFTVALEDFSGSFEAEFFQLSASGQQSVVPKEWDVMRFRFLADRQNNVFLACTETGVWRIDPEAQEAVKLSADAFQGRSREEIRQEIGTGSPLFWTDDPVLSPNGQYLAYLSNRSDPLAEGDSIWVLDTRTGEEHQLMPQRETWKAMHGFVSEKDIFVEVFDQRSGNRSYVLLNALTGSSTALDFPAAEGMLVQSVSAAGNVALISYGAVEELILLRLGADGKILNASRFAGHFPGSVKFSPAGSKLAAPLSGDPEDPADDVLLVDTASGTGELLELCGGGRERWIENYAWANEVSLLVTRRGDTPGSGITWLCTVYA